MSGQPPPHSVDTPPYTPDPIHTAATNSTSAPPSYDTPANLPPPPLLLHVYHSGVTHHNIQILGPDKTTILYTVEQHSLRKPHLTVYKADTGIVVGTVTFRSISRTIQIVLHNNPIALTAKGIFTSAYGWTSLATTAAGTPMRFTWKSVHNLAGGDLICLDQQGYACSKYNASSFALTKAGKFEIGPSVTGILMDEVIVTGLAMLELKRRNRHS